MLPQVSWGRADKKWVVTEFPTTLVQDINTAGWRRVSYLSCKNEPTVLDVAI